jgi:predicted nucleic acid-binding protein
VRLAVVDASVALSWVVPDEEASAMALRLLLAFHGGEVRLSAPSLWEYEVANALRIGVVRGRIAEQEARDALGSLFDLGISLSDFGPMAGRAWQLAMQHGLTVYDAAYLALAERHRCEFYTADKRLAKAARKTGLVRWVGEFDREAKGIP